MTNLIKFLSADEQPAKADVKMPNCFDLLRLLAAFAVIGQHAFRFIPDTSWLWLTTPDDRQLYWFLNGVPVFFILSGLLVYRSAEKAIYSGIPIRQFYLNRYLRVAPLIYVYTIVVIPILFWLGALNLEVIKSAPKAILAWLFGNFALVPVLNPKEFDFLATGGANGALWTIPAECSFYVVVPLFVLIARKFGFNRMLLVLALTAALGTFLRWKLNLDSSEFGMAGGTLAGKVMKISFLAHMTEFGLGIFWLRYWKHANKSVWLFAVCAVLYLFVKYAPDYAHIKGASLMVGSTNLLELENLLGPFYRLCYLVPLSYTVIWLGYNLPEAWSKLVEKVGDLSFGTYVWHMVILNILCSPAIALNTKLANVNSAFLLIAQVLTVIVAYFSWHYIEKPCLKRKVYTSKTS